MKDKIFILLIILLFILPFCEKTEKKPNISPQKIEEITKNILKLSLVEAKYRDVIYFEKPGFFLSKQLLFSVNVKIKAGIDFNDGFKIEKINNIITITLPPAKLLLIDVDETSIKQFMVSGTITSEEINNIVSKTKEEISKDVFSKGILEKANQNMKRLLRNCLSFLGFKDEDFIIKPLIQVESKNDDTKGKK